MRPSSFLLTGTVKLLVGAFPRWIGCAPENRQRIYFANHTSHIDTVALWAALPIRLRSCTHLLQPETTGAMGSSTTSQERLYGRS